MVKRILLKCKVCGEVFGTNSLYYQHVAIQHSDLKPVVTSEGMYQCPVCHETRKSLARLYQHIGLHHVKANSLRVEEGVGLCGP
ncbi:hypothetical protein HLB03_07885 [Acidianus sp. DSM 29099]|nr:hypothetical protein [Acidianus sp. RZ1]